MSYLLDSLRQWFSRYTCSPEQLSNFQDTILGHLACRPIPTLSSDDGNGFDGQGHDPVPQSIQRIIGAVLESRVFVEHLWMIFQMFIVDIDYSMVATLAKESTSRQEAPAVDGSYLYSMNYSAPKLVPFYAV